MGRNSAREQVGEPKVTPPVPPLPPVEMPTMGGQLVNHDATDEVRSMFASLTASEQRREAIARDSAELVLGHGGLMARAYALAAAEHCKGADTNGASRASARRLLRLALAHLEA